MKTIDAHVHVFNNLQGFRGEGELYPIGNGKGRWANGDIVDMIPEGLGEKAFTYETCYRFLKENGVEKAVLLQGSFYGFANEYVAEAIKAHPDFFVGAGTLDVYKRQVYGYHAYNYKRGEDLYIYAPSPELSTAENILMMLREDRKYTKLEAKILDMALVLHMDHGGGNNSTFTTHVVTSCLLYTSDPLTADLISQTL